MDDIREQLADLKLKLVNSDRNVLNDKILEMAPCLIIELKSQLIIKATKRVNDLFGFVYNELEGKIISDLIPSGLKSKHDHHLKDYAENPTKRNMGHRDMILKGIKKDKSEISVKIGLEPFFEDGTCFVIGTVIET